MQWQTPAVAVPLISPPSSLAPLPLIHPSSTLVTALSAACSTVDAGPAWGPDGQKHREKEYKKNKRERERGRFWGVSQACQLEANNRRDPFLWTLIRPVNVFSSPATVSVQREPAGETLLSQCCQFTPTRLQRDGKMRGKRQRQEGRGTTTAAAWCLARKHGRVRSTQWQTRREPSSRPGRLTAAHCVSDYWNQINKCHSCKELLRDSNLSQELQEKLHRIY